MRWVLRSKIHQAMVTGADLSYVDSIAIEEDLIDKTGFWPDERVLVVNNATGTRLETYVIARQRNSGTICMNGAALHSMKVGEEIIVMGFELAEEPIRPKIVLVNGKNRFVRYL